MKLIMAIVQDKDSNPCYKIVLNGWVFKGWQQYVYHWY